MVALFLLAAGCSGGGRKTAASTTTSTTASTTTSTTTSTTAAPTSTTAAPASTTSAAPARPRLVQVAKLGSPISMAFVGDSWLVAEKSGQIRVVRGGQATGTAVDLSGEVSTGGEQGLLGIAVAPDGKHLYADFTNRAGDTRVVEWGLSGTTVDTGSRRDVFAIAQPYANHNGGSLVFGPDGLLYIGLGDGGSERDPDNRAQNLDDLLGKILRIDVRAAGARPAIWVYGVRNPWRFSFDRATGDAWIGDVGQDTWEEVDRLPAGTPPRANLGWSLREGLVAFKGADPPGAVDPVVVYSHAGGSCAVTGGYVYRGRARPDLVGQYVFGDFCSGQVMAASGSGTHWTSRRLGLNASQLSSFAEDPDGELYVLSLSGPIYKLS